MFREGVSIDSIFFTNGKISRTAKIAFPNLYASQKLFFVLLTSKGSKQKEDDRGITLQLL